MNQINFNAPWDPLSWVLVGASYSPAFYEPIKNSNIRDSLQKIAKETEEDYQNLISVLTGLGVKVDRPVIDPNVNIMDYVNDQGKLTYQSSNSFTLIPRPPMQPRDSILVVGNIVVESNFEFLKFENLLNNNVTIKRNTFQNFDAPLVTVIGQHIIVDCRDHPGLPDYIQLLFPSHTVVPVQIGGHNDAVFCPVRPGLIVSTYYHTNYTDTFPDWKIKYIENQSWNAIPEWRTFKHSNLNKWWAPDQENNSDFTNFVNTWLDNWLGYVKETVFDVNMLQIDENTVLVNNYNKDLFDFFKTQKIEPIVTPFRHRFFWDGGIHCITADLYRHGEKNVYITY